MERDKKPPINRVNVEYIDDFSAGLNTTISPSLLNKNEAQVAEDVSFEQKGTIVPRKGRRKRYSQPFTNQPISGITGYYKKDGTSRLILAAGDKLYSDEPHLEVKFTNQTDFERGLVGDRTSLTLSPGSIKIIAGNSNATTTSGNPSATGTAGYTYGWTFTPNKNLRVYELKARAVLANKDYKVSLYKASDKSLIRQVFVKQTTADTVGTVDIRNAPIDLVAGTQYMLCVWCADANAFKFPTVTPSSDLTINGAFSATKDEYPTTTYANRVDLSFTYDPVEDLSINYDSDTQFNTGTKQGVTVINGSVVLTLQGSSKTENDDLSTGTLTNVSVRNGKLALNQLPTWQPYSGKTWSEISV